ncbi:MAG: tRNA pseudouridine(55) synthase TruB [Nocardioidaceae bacterium]
MSRADDAVLVVDKPGGMTSHDVVARVRRFAGTRKVGHAGTLDPMATGVLVLGIGRATRLLGHLMAGEKAYEATIRLGEATTSDDADGDSLGVVDATSLNRERIEHELAAFVGDIEQVPSSVSAIKVDGRRAYERVRAGEQVRLAGRQVQIAELAVRDVSPAGRRVDVDVSVTCSSGTYIRAIARDLGLATGVGGHLVRLRRTRVGAFTLDDAASLASLGDHWSTTPMAEVARRCFPVVQVDDDQARRVRTGRPVHGMPLPANGPTAVLDATGSFLALYERAGDDAKAVAVFVG